MVFPLTGRGTICWILSNRRCRANVFLRFFLGRISCNSRLSRTTDNPGLQAIQDTQGAQSPPQTYKVVFVCAGESARGLIAQAILNRWAGDRFHAWCAVTGETGEVHPLTIALLKSNQLWTGQQDVGCEQLTGRRLR